MTLNYARVLITQARRDETETRTAGVGTMSKELIERLRGNPFAVRGADYLEAADAIESLTAERDRLAQKPAGVKSAILDNAPSGTTHIRKSGRRSFSGGEFAVYFECFKLESGEWSYYYTDNDNEYPHWRSLNGGHYRNPDEIVKTLIPITAPVPAAVPSTIEETIRTATQYAHDLVVSLHRDHYADNNTFEPFDDLLGLLSQIDNMLCGWKEPAHVTGGIVDTLRKFNAWRKGEIHEWDVGMHSGPDPQEITKAIDDACAMLAAAQKKEEGQ